VLRLVEIIIGKTKRSWLRFIESIIRTIRISVLRIAEIIIRTIRRNVVSGVEIIIRTTRRRLLSVRGTIIRPTSRRFLSSWEIIIRPKRKRRKFDSRKSPNQFRATQSNPNKDAGRIDNTPLLKWEPISYDGLQSEILALRISTNPPGLCLQR
jgi:hypothetical protein